MIPFVFLRSVEIFDGLTDEELTKVQTCCEEVHLGDAEVVFKENDPAEFLYTLVEGHVSLRYKLPSRKSGEESRIASIAPGDTFGWSGLHPTRQYTLTAYCVGKNCVALKIRARDLQAILDGAHTIGYKVMRNVARLIGDRFIALQGEMAKVQGQDQIDGW